MTDDDKAPSTVAEIEARQIADALERMRRRVARVAVDRTVVATRLPAGLSEQELMTGYQTHD